MKLMLIFMTLMSSVSAYSADETEVKDSAKAANVKYKESGRIDFESLLIEGERKKPELSVVTGNIGEKDSGLMVYRSNFSDMMANDFGEVIE